MRLTQEENGFVAACDNPDRWKDEKHGRCKGLIRRGRSKTMLLLVTDMFQFTYCSIECHEKAMVKYRSIGHPYANIKPIVVDIGDGT